MRRIAALSTAAMLALAPAAFAQGDMGRPPAASARPSYSDDQMRAFARATLELNAGPQDADSMSQAILRNGMSVEDYNRMGDEMRADAGLADSLDPFLQTARAERAMRLYPKPAPRAQAPKARRSKAVKATKARKGKARRAKGAAPRKKRTVRKRR